MVSPGRTVSGLGTGFRSASKRIIFSYVLDWILILGIVAVGGAFSFIDGKRHAFSLDDINISYPQVPETVSMPILLIVVLIAPGIITALVCLLFVPGPTANKSTPKALIWRRKLWEWNTAWMGLGLALGGAFLITEGLKDLAGKPRPFLLAVCNPDTSPGALQKYHVGGLGSSVTSEFPILVDSRICQNKDKSAIRDAFASFPSGHSSFSWAGMLYLTLFLSAKFAIQVPFLAPASFNQGYISTFEEEDDLQPNPQRHLSPNLSRERSLPPRNQASAPPIYLLIIAFIPIGTAFFISTSRWFDYRHHGFDIISGSLIGIFTAWFAFRWYHLPIRRGAGWSWGARTKDRAFWAGVGLSSYTGNEGWDKEISRTSPGDLETGCEVTSAGMADHPQSQGIIGNHITETRTHHEEVRTV